MLDKIFGKQARLPADEFGGLPFLGTPVEGGLRLTMEEIRQFVLISAARRGYPEPSHEMIADRVTWLDRRSLPGFGAWINELLDYQSETIEQRFSLTRPDGSLGRACPLFFGAKLDDKLDELTASDKPILFDAPSNPVLLLPKLARFIAPLGRLIMINWIKDNDEIAASVMDGFRIVHRGNSTQLFEAFTNSAKIGVSRYPEETQPVPPLRPAHRDEIVVPEALMGRLIRFMRTTA